MKASKRYRLYAPLGWLLDGLAFMPFRVLYVLSDLTFIIVYYVARYRRRVVLDNITASFPNMSERDCRRTARRFFRHLVDLFFETVKLRHITDEQMRRRMIFENIELVDRLFDNGQSIVCYFSHCMNWEWATSITLWTRHKPSDKIVFSQVYRPLVNGWFDNFFLNLRSRFHSVSYSKHTVLRDLVRQRRDGQTGICGFMSDQKPSHGDPGHLMLFLNHPTAMITGTELMARKLDQAVVYMDMYRLRRGHFKIVMRLVAEHPEEMPPMAITESYARMLESTIKRDPSNWLWSHKRWKIPVTLPQENNEQ